MKSTVARYPSRLVRGWRPVAAAVLLLLAGIPAVPLSARAPQQAAAAQPRGMSARAAAQIDALAAEKRARTPTQRKIDSQLLYGARIAAGRAVATGVTSLRVTLPMTADNRALLDVRATVSDALIARLRGLGADVQATSSRYRHLAVRAPLDLVEAIAGLPEIDRVAPDYGFMTSRGVAMSLRTIAGPLAVDPPAARPGADRQRLAAALREVLQSRTARATAAPSLLTNTGGVLSQGDATHRAADARAFFGVTGAGVRIGVLSDGVRTLADSQARGEIGAVTVLGPPAPCAVTQSCDEGTAMLEIVADLAPGAQLFFASASGGTATFAQRIRDLRAAGCDIIVDDVFYFVESAFQDGQTTTSDTNGGIIIQAVKDVAASGALYFSSAGNSGRLSAGTSGAWEGDFVDGGTAAPPLPLDAGRVHNFGTAASPQLFDTLVSAGAFNTLTWAEPLGGATSDYDLYLLDSAGGELLSAGTNFQGGAEDPFEIASGGTAGNRLVIARFSGETRFLHLDTNRGVLQVATAGQIHGHAATSAANTFGVAASPACGGFGSTGPCSAPFTAANKVETFSSDGPRRIFFAETGAAITPGNFSSSGGRVLQKPDITAADGVSTSVRGFSSFFGTSAAAPHAAAIAALVKSRNLAQTASAVSTALISTAIDINTPGWDRDGGFGIVMALQAAPVPPAGLRLLRSGPGSAIATWNSVPNATLYTLKMSTASGAAKTPVASVSGTSATVSGLSRGQTYYFTVAASGAGGASGDSAEVAFTIAVRDAADDFDGDGRSDPLVWRPSSGQWFWAKSSTPNFTGQAPGVPFGGLGDRPLIGDIDGDGLSDIVVFRESTGQWFWLTSSTGYDQTQYGTVTWGGRGDVAMLADVDGDGKADPVVWRPSTGEWFWLLSSSNYTAGDGRRWGGSGDVPLLADFDGDGRADITVWRPSTGQWFWVTSTSGYTAGFGTTWGGQGDRPLLGDFDGDRKADITVWRPSTGQWFWLTSSSGFTAGFTTTWGGQGDQPLLADFDRDGKSDIAVFRPSTGFWYWLESSTGRRTQSTLQFGGPGDIPLVR